MPRGKLTASSEKSVDQIWYARNDRLEVNIPYELYARTPMQSINPARRWVSAVNNCGKLGQRGFLVCRYPQQLALMLTASGGKF
jgi:hypothetical protein